jgi:hypothetical protein
MSEAQAKEPEDKEIVVDDTGEAREPEAIEIEVEGDGQPPSGRLSRFERRLRKKTDQVSQAESEAAALREENKLLRLAQQQSMAPTKLDEPDEDSFDSVSEYRVAKRAYDDQRINDAVATQTQELFNQSQQNITQANQTQQQENSISEHYKRADSMNVKNYDELEGNAMEMLGEEFVKAIIANTDNSEEILASMGASPGKTAEIANLLQSNAAKAFAKAVAFKINPNLKVTSLRNTPDPETKLDPGAPAVSNYDKELDKLREKAAEKGGDISEILEFKRRHREQGK